MVHKIYPAQLPLNKANASDTEPAFLDLNLSIHNDIVSPKNMIKGMILISILLISRSLMALSLNVPLMVHIYISQLIRFSRASSHVTDLNNRNKFLTAKVFKQGYRYHKLCKAFSKFYRRHLELIEKYHVSLKKTYATRYL